MSDPIEEQHRDIMNDVAQIMNDIFKGYGFCLMVFKFGPEGERMNYISNAERPAMIAALKEFTTHLEADQASH